MLDLSSMTVSETPAYVTGMLSKLYWVPPSETRHDSRVTAMFKIINDLIINDLELNHIKLLLLGSTKPNLGADTDQLRVIIIDNIQQTPLHTPTHCMM